MKKYLYLSTIILFIGLFIASPYILDYWQYRGVLEATGGMPVTDGPLQFDTGECEGSCTIMGVDTCCRGDNGTGCMMSIPPTCIDYDMKVTESAGGSSCATGYLLNSAQHGQVDGASDVIIAGTLCTSLSVVASENGCIGCTAMINDSKVYFVKNKIKSVVDFIIAGFKE